MVVAVQIASSSVERGFSLSNDAVSGRATHELSAINGRFDESLYLDLRRRGLLDRAAPSLTTTARSEDGQSRFELVGIDPYSNYEVRASGLAADGLSAVFTGSFAVFMQIARARELGYTVGDEIRLQVNGQLREARLGGLLPDQAATRSWLLADISVVQDFAAKAGLLDRVDLILDNEQAAERLRQQLPPTLNLISSRSRSQAQKEMTRALDINMTALSLLALCIGMFLVYNAVSFSVIRRRRQIGLIRALGVTGREVFALVIAEAALIGTLASIAGIGAGVLLADVLLDGLTRTVNDLYFRVEVNRLEYHPLLLLLGFALGIAASVIAALGPAIEATRTEPRAAMLRSDLEQRARIATRRAGVAGLIATALGLLVVAVGGRSLVMAFFGLFMFITGSALMVPIAVTPVTRLFAGIAQKLGGHIGLMAVRNIDRSRSRTGVALAALVVAVSATSGVGMMIGNFRISVTDWLSTYLTADVYVAANEDLDRQLPPDFIERVRGLGGVEAVDLGRWAKLADGQTETAVFALDTSEVRFRRYRLIAGESEGLYQRFVDGAVLITEPLAWKRSLKPGDAITLPTARGSRDFPIAGVYRDYGTDSGVVLMNGASYRSNFDDQNHSSMGLYLDETTSDVSVADQLRSLAELPATISVFSNRTLQSESLAVFDRTFAVTRVLRLLAIIIAVVGIVSALAAIQTERLQQSALLRAVGLTSGQLTRMSLTEAAVMGLIAGLLAMPLGVMSAWILANVVNRRAFGWSMEFHIDFGVLAEGVAIAVLAAFIAGALAALSLNAQSPASALRYE